MKNLFVGGTFDPIHNGHLLAARATAEICGCDCVVLVPSALTDHKSDKTMFCHRYEMARLAVEGDKFFDVSSIEQDIATTTGKSYSATVALELQKRYNTQGERVLWMIGSDSISKVVKCGHQEILKSVVTFVIASRPGTNVLPGLLCSHGLDFIQTNSPEIDLSSTEIRERVVKKQSIRYMTPDAVSDYIFANHLYHHK